jgi:hypothetical protein
MIEEQWRSFVGLPLYNRGQGNPEIHSDFQLCQPLIEALSSKIIPKAGGVAGIRLILCKLPL